VKILVHQRGLAHPVATTTTKFLQKNEAIIRAPENRWNNTTTTTTNNNNNKRLFNHHFAKP
jgi:hypothetical protein